MRDPRNAPAPYPTAAGKFSPMHHAVAGLQRSSSMLQVTFMDIYSAWDISLKQKGFMCFVTLAAAALLFIISSSEGMTRLSVGVL